MAQGGPGTMDCDQTYKKLKWRRRGSFSRLRAGEGGPCVGKGRMRAAPEEASGPAEANAGRPHPTRLRRATFSHKWEKERLGALLRKAVGS